ncbi:MAG: hypothetical protein H7834_14505 [Magnetococcus sp. YQC-9]
MLLPQQRHDLVTGLLGAALIVGRSLVKPVEHPDDQQNHQHRLDEVLERILDIQRIVGLHGIGGIGQLNPFLLEPLFIHLPHRVILGQLADPLGQFNLALLAGELEILDVDLLDGLRFAALQLLLAFLALLLKLAGQNDILFDMQLLLQGSQLRRRGRCARDRLPRRRCSTSRLMLLLGGFGFLCLLRLFF